MNLTKGQIMMIHNMVNCELSDKNTVYSITELVNLKEQLALNDVVKPLKTETELAIDGWLKINNYTLTNNGYTRNGITFSFSEMHKRYNDYLKTL